jgi:hypothetical protein
MCLGGKDANKYAEIMQDIEILVINTAHFNVDEETPCKRFNYMVL